MSRHHKALKLGGDRVCVLDIYAHVSGRILILAGRGAAQGVDDDHGQRVAAPGDSLFDFGDQDVEVVGPGAKVGHGGNQKERDVLPFEAEVLPHGDQAPLGPANSFAGDIGDSTLLGLATGKRQAGSDAQPGSHQQEALQALWRPDC